MLTVVLKSSFGKIYAQSNLVSRFWSRVALIGILSCAPILTSAGELARDSRVVQVASSSNNRDVFSVELEGGRGPCSNRSVTFDAAKSQSEASYNQAFSIALAALMSGNRVRVHNYDDNECSGANFISVYAD